MRHNLKLRLIYLLANEPMSTAQIAESLGIARRTAQKMIRDFQTSSDIETNITLVKVGTKYAVDMETGWPWLMGAVKGHEPAEQEAQP